ncbi:MAG: monooxygenase [Amycolatopsis sp.]|uniref:flavin-containing monooxygenase n=1 Tax=Amycolatopsis sp. TaxID=37632 RepID=UPI0026242F7F|nr:NAD(P)/FAD-dependent oxidoreductase [Amycolatopsis sp.]MCU1679552.1 monooxygenase [Amycolatopsis sp.]
MTADDTTLRAALDQGNLPILLLVLAQLTGDAKWLEEPYRPSRTLALSDNDDGGFTESRQAEIRAAAFTVLRDWRDGRRVLPQPPADDRITAMLSVSLGEHVPPEYGETMAEEAGFHTRSEVSWSGDRPAGADRLHVLIVGAGLSGVATAATLERLGIPYTIVEKNPAVGGVWWRNTYPGAGVDTPSDLYSYSFAPRRGWNRYYAKQPEILSYVQNTAQDLGITAKVQFGTELTSATWDEANQRWHIRLRRADGTTETLEATAVISCVGVLSRKSIPDFDGTDTFSGPMFHSSEWDHSVDVAGKRVAIIGTGATSQQMTPALAGVAGSVLVFQRSPQWVAPNANYLRDAPTSVRLLMEQVPFYATFYRLRLIWQFQDKLLPSLRRDPAWPHQDRSINATNEKHRVFFTEHIDRELGARTDLRKKVLPTYPPYGKRILMDNDWIATIKRDDVKLVPEAVTGFDEGNVITADGARHPADIVVLATGFQATRMLAPMEIRGRSGTSLHELWGDDDAFAYLGMSVPDFPNFFIVGGPNTALGHGGSAIYIAECSIAYIAQMLIAMVQRGLSSVEVREDVAKAYNARVDTENESLIWTHPGMTNWYRNQAGRIVTTLPWRGVDFWSMTKTPDLDDFTIRQS